MALMVLNNHIRAARNQLMRIETLGLPMPARSAGAGEVRKFIAVKRTVVRAPSVLVDASQKRPAP